MSEDHSYSNIEDVVLCSQTCNEINSLKDEKEEKEFEKLSSESSDSYYKNKFRFKKNSIEIKKKSLLKNKLKNNDIQEIIKNDPILSNLNKTMISDAEVFDLANKKENKTKFKLENEKKGKKNSTNNKNKNNSVLFLNENLENQNQLNDNKKYNYQLNEQTCDINDISEDILKQENHLTNIDKNEKLEDNDDTLIINEQENKLQLNFTKKEKNKKKKEIKSNEQNKIKQNNQNFNSSILSEIKKNKELSPLSLIKKHGRLINNIEEIYNSNCEQIQNVRDEFAELKNDLNKIMNLINIGQKAVASLK
ncbi:conserved Plasmodium protein, unknown function [Plasmodium gaboni]|uniref:Uncharacterized protein n=1 Tax=Plasmodium gaboni TaxID=647221 RepID=A0ABY1UPK1_9APIC|nr:conserved Plasmodium protein, unknown function [Plasmodium gaboni]